ncbi:MAG: TldD/PmbA family protein [Candidatus Bathyarchaeota archaeon]|nr:TldD/PmbA family protein [Candidatus Bathyarchaeota archaeon]
MKELLKKLTGVAATKFDAEYAEVRAQKLSKTSFTMKEGCVEAAKQGVENGVALRVLVNGAWGFASVGSFSFEALTDALSNACAMAKAAAFYLKLPVKLAPTKTVEDYVQIKSNKNPAHVSIEDKIKTAQTINKTALAFDGRVKSCTVDYLDLTGRSYFANTDGTYIEQDRLYVWSKLSATAKQNGVFTYSREEIGSTAGYEVFDLEPPEQIGEKLAERAVNQLRAEPVKGGTFPVVLGPNVVGVFVHEAFGHLAEADLALAGGVLANNLGKKIASDLVTFYDDGTLEGAFGSFKYDDEGVPAQKSLLIKNGFVQGLMHNRETAQKFNTQPTGNARAEDFRLEPLIRMRNTYFEPRDYSFEELLEGVREGYYLKSFRGGQANIDGTFQVGIQEAFEIVNGEVSKPVRDSSISGSTLETLFKVDAVGKDFALYAGRCGKGQTAFIGDGGPHIRVKEVLVGGSA